MSLPTNACQAERSGKGHSDAVHRYRLSEISEAYRVFSNRLDGVLKVSVTPILTAYQRPEGRPSGSALRVGPLLFRTAALSLG